MGGVEDASDACVEEMEPEGIHLARRRSIDLRVPSFSQP